MIEFSDGEKERIKKWVREGDGEIALRFAMTGHLMDERFKAYLDRFGELVPGVMIKKDGDAGVERPTIFIDNRIAYQALPLDRELEPFLQILRNQDAFVKQIPPDVRRKLEQLHLPALVKVYITPHCPYCPATVSTLMGLAAISDQVRVTVIDGELFVDAAQKDHVSSAPTVILDDQFRWIGSVDAGEMVTLMLDRDPANLGAQALKSMIEDGNANGVADMMTQRKKLFPAFIELLVHPRWSVRLGAMVVFETLAEENLDLAGNVVEPLMDVFSDVDDMIRGDMLYVMGESGNPAALPFLETVSQGEFDDEVKDAANEAVEKLTDTEE